MVRIALVLALGISSPAFAQDEAAETDEVEEPAVEEAPPDEIPAVEAEPEEEAPAQPPHIESPTERPADAHLASQLRQRNDLGTIHRAFGIATWGAMLVTSVLGFLQYYNMYGFFSAREDTPCVAGGAVFGQEQCWGTPWPHLVSALTTTALYATTFVLSLTIPDPLDAAHSNADLRLHKDLRWVHFAGMIAQLFLGFATANDWFGFDRANDYEAQQVLASVHQLVGWTTFGFLTAAGLIMLF